MADLIHDIPLYLNEHLLNTDPNELAEMVTEELAAFRYVINGSRDTGGITPAQLRGWMAFMNDNLDNKEHRIPLLIALTGVPIYTSTNYLTYGVMSALIDWCTYEIEDSHPKRPLEKVKIWKPTEWYRNVCPGIEWLIDYSGGVCPVSLYQPHMKDIYDAEVALGS